MPMLRRAGIGSASSERSEIATVVPLKTTAEPACFIALRTAVSLATSPPRRSSRQRTTTRRA